MLVSIGFGSAFQVRTELAASQLELTEERQALESEHYLPKSTEKHYVSNRIQNRIM